MISLEQAAGSPGAGAARYLGVTPFVLCQLALYELHFRAFHGAEKVLATAPFAYRLQVVQLLPPAACQGMPVFAPRCPCGQCAPKITGLAACSVSLFSLS